MPINITRYYTPHNRMNVSWKRNEKAYLEDHRRGYIDGDGRGVIERNIETTYKVESFSINIIYTGDIDIGHEGLFKGGITTKNYWEDPNIIQQAREKTGILYDTTLGVDICNAISCVLFIFRPCMYAYRNDHIKKRLAIVSAKTTEIANDLFERDLEKYMREFDEFIDRRIAAKQQGYKNIGSQSSGTSSEGNSNPRPMQQPSRLIENNTQTKVITFADLSLSQQLEKLAKWEKCLLQLQQDKAQGTGEAKFCTAQKMDEEILYTEGRIIEMKKVIVQAGNARQLPPPSYQQATNNVVPITTQYQMHQSSQLNYQDHYINVAPLIEPSAPPMP